MDHTGNASRSMAMIIQSRLLLSNFLVKGISVAKIEWHRYSEPLMGELFRLMTNTLFLIDLIALLDETKKAESGI
jgi:hypothetical protein